MVRTGSSGPARRAKVLERIAVSDGIVLSTVPDSDSVAASTMVFASGDWPIRLDFPTMSIATDIRSNNDVNGGP